MVLLDGTHRFRIVSMAPDEKGSPLSVNVCFKDYDLAIGVYTDGSRTVTETDFAIYVPRTVGFSQICPSLYSVIHVEMLAIVNASSWIINHSRRTDNMSLFPLVRGFQLAFLRLSLTP